MSIIRPVSIPISHFHYTNVANSLYAYTSRCRTHCTLDGTYTIWLRKCGGEFSPEVESMDGGLL